MNLARTHRFSILLSTCTLILLCAGALVTSTGSGLAVPDWPLSYGQYFPPMVGGVLFEHGHRLIAGFVATLCFLFTFFVWFGRDSKSVRYTAAAASLTVVLQASLGGLTVLLRLPPQVSVAHACLAQIFFSLTVVLVILTSNQWREGYQKVSGNGRGLRVFVLLVTVGLFIQLLMGATMRHIGAGLAISDFPTIDGGWLPAQFTLEKSIHFAHRIGALVMTLSIVALVAYIFRRFSDNIRIVMWSGLLFTFVMVQIFLGALVIWLGKPVIATTVHLAVGAICLACSVALTLVTFRVVEGS
jgi:heme a synthase